MIFVSWAFCQLICSLLAGRHQFYTFSEMTTEQNTGKHDIMGCTFFRRLWIVKNCFRKFLALLIIKNMTAFASHTQDGHVLFYEQRPTRKAGLTPELACEKRVPTFSSKECLPMKRQGEKTE